MFKRRPVLLAPVSTFVSTFVVVFFSSVGTEEFSSLLIRLGCYKEQVKGEDLVPMNHNDSIHLLSAWQRSV